MAQNLTNEAMVRQYFLGQLTGEERERIEERFFTDPKFSEELLTVEDELFDDYVLGLLQANEQKNFRARFLPVPLQMQKLELAKALKRYTLEAASTESLTLNTTFPLQLPIVNGIISHLNSGVSFFRRLLSPLVQRKQTVATPPDRDILFQGGDYETWERLLSEAQTNRNLLASLIDEDWRGLCLLAQLRLSSSVREDELASKFNLGIVDVALTLARLVKCGLVDEQQGEFSCTRLGTEALQKLERASGITLM